MESDVCRTCLRSANTLMPLFDDLLLQHKIATISSIWIDADEDFPKKICAECVSNINLSYNFRKVIINSDLELKERYAALKNMKHSGLTKVQENETTNAEIEEPEVQNDIKDILIETNVKHFSDGVEQDIMSIGNQNISSDDEDIINEDKRITFKNIMIFRRKVYECKSCKFTCTESSKWQNHKRTFHVARGICSICGKSIRTDNLQKHIKSHTEAPVPCSTCGKMFKNTESLRSHSLIHAGVDFVCKLCGKSYKYRGEYNRHVKRHSMNGIRSVKCSLCDKLFFDTKGMKKHIRSHTGERPYICKYCQKGFSSGYALKTHIRQHTHEKPFICEYCPMAFPQKVSLRSHLKSKHSSNKVESG